MIYINPHNSTVKSLARFHYCQLYSWQGKLPESAAGPVSNDKDVSREAALQLVEEKDSFSTSQEAQCGSGLHRAARVSPPGHR